MRLLVFLAFVTMIRLFGKKKITIVHSSIYLHRIVVNPNHKGKKQFEKITLWTKNHIKEKNIDYIRMDTWADNPTIIDYYKSFGFQSLNNFTTPNTLDLPVQH